MGGPVRLQRFLARAGVASRRRAEDLIVAGRVSVNGVVVTELGTRVDPGTDRIAVDGRPAVAAAVRWLVLNKPVGFVCTRRDPQGRRTVYDLLPAEAAPLFTVGRLDADTEGLLLLTNDGEAANRLLHPRYACRRVYEADVRGVPGPEVLAQLERGVELEDGPARVSDVRVVGAWPERSRLRLGIREGRKREVRRLLAAVGHPVQRLRRVRFGPIALGSLARGAVRELQAAEIRALERATGRRIDADNGNEA